MILSDNYSHDPNTAIFLMASLSPKVQELLDLELYRQTADQDGATEQYILEKSFKSLTDDLETIGVILATDYSDVTEDLDKLFLFLQFVSYLLPNSLYGILKHQSVIQDCVSHLLNGTMGNGETLIQTYLSELGGLDGQPPLVEALVPIVDQFYSITSQTESFTDYLKNLMSLIADERLLPESHTDDHQIYRDIVRKIVSQLTDAVNVFEDHAFFDDLCCLKNRVIQDFIVPANFTKYSYIFTQSEARLPEDLIESYQKQMYYYRVSNPWCFEYFTLRHLEPSDVQSVLLYCFAYALCETQDQYTTMTKDYPPSLVTQEIKTLYTGDAS